MNVGPQDPFGLWPSATFVVPRQKVWAEPDPELTTDENFAVRQIVGEAGVDYHVSEAVQLSDSQLIALTTLGLDMIGGHKLLLAVSAHYDNVAKGVRINVAVIPYPTRFPVNDRWDGFTPQTAEVILQSVMGRLKALPGFNARSETMKG